MLILRPILVLDYQALVPHPGNRVLLIGLIVLFGIIHTNRKSLLLDKFLVIELSVYFHKQKHKNNS